MTGRERLQTVLAGRLPDHVPVAPDTSNMIPAKRTGKPFWDVYLYKDPPLWKAYIDCVKHFGFDSLMDGYADIRFPDMEPPDETETAIVFRSPERIVTQKYRTANGKKFWEPTVSVYYVADPPTAHVNPLHIGLPLVPESSEPLAGVREWPEGPALLSLVKRELGDHGLVGVVCGTTGLIWNEQTIYDYYDDPAPFLRRRDELLEYFEKKFHRLMALEDRPDFIATGGSGTLTFQTVETFRQLGLPIVQRITKLCKDAGVPSQIHSCGPEKELVKILAEETDLTIVDPLEVPPMGDCDLRELKRLYGKKLVLKGNIHTTKVMLHGTVDEVRDASRKAIDDAAAGGRFVLSTGDQCGRDTPEENIFAMIDTAKTYGRYA